MRVGRARGPRAVTNRVPGTGFVIRRHPGADR